MRCSGICGKGTCDLVGAREPVFGRAGRVDWGLGLHYGFVLCAAQPLFEAPLSEYIRENRFLWSVLPCVIYAKSNHGEKVFGIDTAFRKNPTKPPKKQQEIMVDKLWME